MQSIVCWTLFLAVPAFCQTAEVAASFVNEATINAPVAAVWNVWTSGDAYKSLGVAKAEVDLRVGGLIRAHYRATGVLGDEETVVNKILAYEPQRMIATRIEQPPKSLPFKEAWKTVWTVITLTDVGKNQTHVRVASMGFGADEESIAMRRFFETGNATALRTLQDHFEGKK